MRVVTREEYNNVPVILLFPFQKNVLTVMSTFFVYCVLHCFLSFSQMYGFISLCVGVMSPHMRNKMFICPEQGID